MKLALQLGVSIPGRSQTGSPCPVPYLLVRLRPGLANPAVRSQFHRRVSSAYRWEGHDMAEEK
jgi:hypothetical protein